MGEALADNPPPARDRPLLQRLRRVGVGPGLSPAEQNLPADVLQALGEGVEAEAAELPGQTRVDVLSQALANGGWLTLSSRIGRYGTDYLLRAQLALLGIGANAPEESVYPTALADSTGSLLTGAGRYRLVFRRGQLPPVRGFWSITMYDFDGFLGADAARRYSLWARRTRPSCARRDGSIVIAIQRARPAEADVNWLPRRRPASGSACGSTGRSPRCCAATGGRRRSSDCREAALLRRRPKGSARGLRSITRPRTRYRSASTRRPPASPPSPGPRPSSRP